MTPDELNKKAELSARRRLEAERNEALRPFMLQADAAFTTCGLGHAPLRRASETEVQHATGVLDQLLGHVGPLKTMPTRWKGFDPKSLTEMPAVAAIAPTIFHDAVAAFTAPEGALRSAVETDRTGREIVKFYGDPGEAWRPFRQEPRYVTAWNRPGYGRGKNSLSALRPVETLMSDGSVRPAR